MIGNEDIKSEIAVATTILAWHYNRNRFSRPSQLKQRVHTSLFSIYISAVCDQCVFTCCSANRNIIPHHAHGHTHTHTHTHVRREDAQRAVRSHVAEERERNSTLMCWSRSRTLILRASFFPSLSLVLEADEIKYGIVRVSHFIHLISESVRQNHHVHRFHCSGDVRSTPINAQFNNM